VFPLSAPAARPFSLSVARRSAPFELEVMTDTAGSIVFGWLAQNALYVRFTGGLSATLGSAFAVLFQGLLEGKTSVRFFNDGSGLKHYDLLARSAIMRVLLANRRSFESFTLLTWAGEIGPAAQALVVALGEGVEILTSSEEFEARLLRYAPNARHKLDPKSWVRRPSPEPRR
jgi:hypothetical protein